MNRRPVAISLMLMFKRKLTGYVGSLTAAKIRELDRALGVALDLTPVA